MRLLILGAGGIGGYFGGRLAAAKVDVAFLVRPARAAALAEHGLIIHSPRGDLTVPVRTVAVPRDAFDAVVLACKAYDLEDAMTAVAPAIGPETVILPLLNGIRHLDRLDARFGAQPVLGGLCHIGVTRDAAGAIVHLNTLQHLVLGARRPEQADRVERLHEVLAHGGFAPTLSATIAQDLWEKFVFLAAYAGLTTLMRAPVGAIVATTEGDAIARAMLRECIAIATACGYAPRPAAMTEMEATLTEPGSRGTSSMLRDLISGGATEHEHILGDMVHRGRQSSIDCPLLTIALVNMRTYEEARRSYCS